MQKAEPLFSHNNTKSTSSVSLFPNRTNMSKLVKEKFIKNAFKCTNFHTTVHRLFWSYRQPSYSKKPQLCKEPIKSHK
ncbi:hypothetical protein Hdeb2414_s0002g00047451 [Helianthus debilis subsp. tardiflorus]